MAFSLEDYYQLSNAASLGIPGVVNFLELDQRISDLEDDQSSPDLSALTGRVDNLETLTDDHETRITDLEGNSIVNSSGFGVLNVTEAPYSATGDGSTDDRAAIQSALDDAVTSGAAVYFPPGVYIVGKSPSGAWCLTVGANVTIFGVRGKSWIKAKAGMLSTACPIVRFQEADNFVIRDIGIHGNWGNGYTRVTKTSHLDTLPQSTINVKDTSEFPSSGTFVIMGSAGAETITYTGKTSTTFTGCTGGTGTIVMNTEIGILDDKTGINHSDQTDPQNHAIMVRGCENGSITRVLLRQVYGDGIWTGTSATDFSKATRNLHVSEVDCEVTGRDGISFAQAVDGATVWKCQFRAIFAQACDIEPVDQFVRNITVEHCKLGFWWNPSNVGRNTNSSVAIVGGNFLANATTIHARSVTVRDCVINGSIIIESAADVLIEKNRILCDFSGHSYAPIFARIHNDALTIRDNWVYDRTTGASAGLHEASILCRFYASGANVAQPAGLKISGNKVFSRNGVRGIEVNGTGSHAYSTTAVVADETNTATSTTSTTVTRSGASWTTNQWIGWLVRIGNATGAVVSNTGTVLTLYTPSLTASSGQAGWYDPTGNPVATPAAGTYLLFKPDGVAVIENNEVDCSNDGNGAGAEGISMQTDRAGTRVICRNNRVLNATGAAYRIKSQDTARQFLDLQIYDNYAWDNQLTPTTTTVLGFTTGPYYASMTLRNNHASTGITTYISGLTSGVWLVNDGARQDWEGYGSPNTVITAPKGSSFYRRDGGAGTCFYINEDGTNTGWSGK